MNDRSETEFASVEDLLNMQRIASNERFLVFQIQNIINDENVIIAPGHGKKVSILSDEFCEEQAFPYLLPKGKFGYDAPRDIPISPARQDWLLNFNQDFVSDADYISFARSTPEHYTCIHQ